MKLLGDKFDGKPSTKRGYKLPYHYACGFRLQLLAYLMSAYVWELNLKNLLCLLLLGFVGDVSLISWCKNPSVDACKGEEKRVEMEGIAAAIVLYVLVDIAHFLLSTLRSLLQMVLGWGHLTLKVKEYR